MGNFRLDPQFSSLKNGLKLLKVLSFSHGMDLEMPNFGLEVLYFNGSLQISPNSKSSEIHFANFPVWHSEVNFNENESIRSFCFQTLSSQGCWEWS